MKPKLAHPVTLAEIRRKLDKRRQYAYPWMRPEGQSVIHPAKLDYDGAPMEMNRADKRGL